MKAAGKCSLRCYVVLISCLIQDMACSSAYLLVVNAWALRSSGQSNSTRACMAYHEATGEAPHGHRCL
jgi:hypothetical protein